ncbi:gamma-glutamyl-gamma-aminobutyrate hydrolase family protein [Erysipelotrichaceae bacterium OttesenSCG-928-M19]|nr:gamma-glutamyl-gamma-aminobutyrate hydrolase family protein [Erysipelotrichaceae bacterium OttesenSCG-928-M19]
MKKPIIGITSNYRADFEEWFNNYYINYVGMDEVNVIIATGGTPIVLPQTTDYDILDEYLNLIDGLVVIGGQDVSPSYYNEDVHPLCSELCPERDICESYLILEAFKRKIPIIAICRGLQLANAIFGGSLYQDLTLNPKITVKHSAMKEGGNDIHSIKVIDKDSRFFSLIDCEELYVNSIHHQIIKELAPDFKSVAISKDNVCEVIEHKDKAVFFIGTQFHPEIMGARGNKMMQNLFRGMYDYLKSK